MRANLLELIEKTIIYRYDLPNNEMGILSTIFSTENDRCYQIENTSNLEDVIYNSILEYSFNEFELEDKDTAAMHAVALKSKIKYNNLAKEETKIKYGFFGEVLLYSILTVMFKVKPLIARGYFYNPLENSETKGYDSYHLVENDGNVELWFGEVKFHIDHKAGIKDVLTKIENALSDSYLEKNIIEFHNHKNNFNIKGSKIETILSTWEANPEINLAHELKKNNIKLIYPILLIYEEDEKGYDENIKKIPEHIQKTYSTKTYNLSVDYSIFFILMPTKTVKTVKSNVIQWIESKKQLV